MQFEFVVNLGVAITLLTLIGVLITQRIKLIIAQKVEIGIRAELKTESSDAMELATHVLIQGCHSAAYKSGWWTDPKTGLPVDTSDLHWRGAKIALMHSELSECLEGMRKGLMDDHLPHFPMEAVELADTIIRICDYAGGTNLPVAEALAEKLLYNAKRADHKPENRIKDGGKSI